MPWRDSRSTYSKPAQHRLLEGRQELRSRGFRHDLGLDDQRLTRKLPQPVRAAFRMNRSRGPSRYDECPDPPPGGSSPQDWPAPLNPPGPRSHRTRIAGTAFPRRRTPACSGSFGQIDGSAWREGERTSTNWKADGGPSFVPAPVPSRHRSIPPIPPASGAASASATIPGWRSGRRSGGGPTACTAPPS